MTGGWEMKNPSQRRKKERRLPQSHKPLLRNDKLEAMRIKAMTGRAMTGGWGGRLLRRYAQNDKEKTKP